MHDSPLDDYILKAIKTAGRNFQRGVLPRMAQPLLPVMLSEQRCRLYMVRLWKDGRLVRVGATMGADLTRRGYRVPSLLEERVGRELMDLLNRFRFGMKLAEIARLLNVELDALHEFALQMEAAGRLVLARGEVLRLPSMIEKMAFEQAGLWPYGVAA